MNVEAILLHFLPLFAILPPVSRTQFRRFTCLFVDVYKARRHRDTTREKDAKTRHYRQVGIIIKPLESRAVFTKVSIISEG